MRKYTPKGALVALALIGLGAAPAAADDVTGIWSAQIRTRGGLGAQMIFTASGQVTSTFGALVDWKYEIEGNEIKVTFTDNHAQPPRSQTGTQPFTIDGDKLTITPAAGQSQVMTRAGAPSRDAHPIVGDWTFTHYTSQPAVQRFSRNGTVQLTVPFVTHKGTYRLVDGALHIEFEGQPLLILTIKREGDLLTTADPKGKQIKFVKFEH